MPKRKQIQESSSFTLHRFLRSESDIRRGVFDRLKSKKSLNSMFLLTENTNDHLLSVYELEQKYHTSVDSGLTNRQANLLYVRYGPNSYYKPKSRFKYVLTFIASACGKFQLVLICCLIFCIVSYALVVHDDITLGSEALIERLFPITVLLTSYIVLEILINGISGVEHEVFKDRVSKQFVESVIRVVLVQRGGSWHAVTADRLVPGDIVHLERGDCVPADIRVLESYNFRVDNSSITGVNHPEDKSNNCTDEDPLETANLIWYGSDVLDGYCKGMVINTGAKTLLGHIETSTAEVAFSGDTLQYEISNFTMYITIQTVSVALLSLLVSFIKNIQPLWGFYEFVTLLATNIPESLIFTMSVILKLSVRRLKKLHCLVKSVYPIEKLGQTSVVCLDKTGTLTERSMTVSHLFYDNIIHNVRQSHTETSLTSNFLYFCRDVMLSTTNVAGTRRRKTSKWSILQDPLEAAIFECMNALCPKTNLIKKYPRIFEIPSTPTTKTSISLHTRPYDDLILQIVKGSPEKVIPRCETILIENDQYIITDFHIKFLNHVMLELGYLGERIIAIAHVVMPSKYSKHYPFTDEPNFPTSGLCFVGLISVINPARPEVAEAIVNLHNARIKTVMLTGDLPITAVAVGRQVGLISEHTDTIFDVALRRSVPVEELTTEERTSCPVGVFVGREIQDMTRHDLRVIISRYNQLIFASLTPEQKQLIVEVYQSQGEVVMMVGDGVNDACALKQADIGVAMGGVGKMVSKRAAGIILLDDNFASIVFAIEEGRLFFENLRKYIVYTLSCSLPKLVPYFIFIVLDMPLFSFISTLILIDVVTNIIPGISIAMQAAERDPELTARKDKLHDLTNIKLILHCYFHIGTAETLAAFATWFYTMGQYGFMPMRLIGIAEKWKSQQNDLLDSYGYEWTLGSRLILNRVGASAYFLSVVINQIANALFITKTHRASIFKNEYKNQLLLRSIVLECILAMGICYTPYVNTFLGFAAIHIYFLWPALLFALITYIINEIRKSIMKANPDSWLANNTY